MNNEAEIIKKIQQGDKEAFEEIFVRYYPSLKRFAETITEDIFWAEDIVIEFFTDFWQKRKKIRITKNLKSYLFYSIKNRTISALRKNKKKKVEKLSETFFLSDNAFNPEDQIINDEKKQNIEDILLLIPPRSREVFLLHRIDGLKYSEIASLLEISPKTVENHISKAMKIMRKHYKF